MINEHAAAAIKPLDRPGFVLGLAPILRFDDGTRPRTETAVVEERNRRIKRPFGNEIGAKRLRRRNLDAAG